MLSYQEKKQYSEKKFQVTVVRGLFTSECARLGLAACPIIMPCSCICCISGASFSGSPQLQSCKQQHKVRKALLDMAFYQLVSKNILIPTCQDFRTDAIPITTVDETETETSLQDKLADGKGNN